MSLVLSACGFAGYSSAMAWHRSHASLEELRQARVEQDRTLHALDRQAGEIIRRLQEVQQENRRLRTLIGAPEADRKPAARPQEQTSMNAGDARIVQARLVTLGAAATKLAAEEAAYRVVALRVLNVRRLEAATRTRLLASIPSTRPVDYDTVASTFGWRTNPWPEFHKGIDLDADEGAPVRATAAGTVVYASWDGGFGQKVEIDHHNGYQTWYAHLSQINVHVGEEVTKGMVIAAVGSTGEATGPHLHYQLMHFGAPIDPAPYLEGVPSAVMASLK